MNPQKKFAAVSAGAVVVAALFTSSAFAENRPSRETHRSSGRIESRSTSTRSEQRQQRQSNPYFQRDYSRNTTRSEGRSFDRNDTNRNFDRNNANRNFDRNNTNRNFDRNNTNRSFDRNNSNRNFDRNNGNRNFDRNYSNNNRYFDRNYSNRNNGRYDNRSYRAPYGFERRGVPYYFGGRVSRYERWGSGFRVWIGGAPYPFFLPAARFYAYPFRVGLFIRLGGYYNPLGYYDYYDVAPADRYYTSGELRGVVESVDYRRDTAVIRDDVSNSFVTVLLNGRDRDLDDLRRGDYVELTGDWTRGVFEAYRVDYLR